MYVSHPRSRGTLDHVRYVLLATGVASAAFLLTAPSLAVQIQRNDRAPDQARPSKLDSSLGWPRPRSAERLKERKAMVDRQIKARGVRDSRVLDAMIQVPRHWFIPDEFSALAYRDRPLPIGEDQTISQPYMVAFMTEALKLDKDARVLEIGTGSGYQAAVLSELTPHVFTIEIVEPLARRAIAAFKRYGYQTIKTKVGDGYEGWPRYAPFDAVIVTCAPDHIPPKLIEQLKPGGRLCIPVGDAVAVQKLVVVTKTKDGELSTEAKMPVRFVPMTGEAQKAERKP